MRMPEEVRVLHLVGGRFFQGGTASVVRDLVRASSIETSNLIWIHRNCPDDDLPFLRESCAEHLNKSITRDLCAALVDLPRLLRAVRERKVDIIHAHTRAGIFAAWLARRFCRVPTLIHLHFLARHKWLYRFLIKTADAAIYNSHHTARHFGADLKTATIVNPTIRWPVEGPEQSRKIRIIAASALLSHKHLDVVAEACTLLANTGMTIETRIYGKTPNCQVSAYEGAVLRAYGDKSFITFDEWNRDWIDSLRTSDIFVHLGEPESFGLVILEAFARGLRLVVLKETFLQELPGRLSSDGIYRSEDLSSASVAKAIRHALESDVSSISLQQERSMVALQFSSVTAAERVSAVYRMLHRGSL